MSLSTHLPPRRLLPCLACAAVGRGCSGGWAGCVDVGAVAPGARAACARQRSPRMESTERRATGSAGAAGPDLARDQRTASASGSRCPPTSTGCRRPRRRPCTAACASGPALSTAERNRARLNFAESRTLSERGKEGAVGGLPGAEPGTETPVGQASRQSTTHRGGARRHRAPDRQTRGRTGHPIRHPAASSANPTPAASAGAASRP